MNTQVRVGVAAWATAGGVGGAGGGGGVGWHGYPGTQILSCPEDGFSREALHAFIRPCAPVSSLWACGSLSFLSVPPATLGEVSGAWEERWQGPCNFLPAEGMTLSHRLLPALPGLALCNPHSGSAFLHLAVNVRNVSFIKSSGSLFDLLSWKATSGSDPPDLGFIALMAPWWNFHGSSDLPKFRTPHSAGCLGVLGHASVLLAAACSLGQCGNHLSVASLVLNDSTCLIHGQEHALSSSTAVVKVLGAWGAAVLFLPHRLVGFLPPPLLFPSVLTSCHSALTTKGDAAERGAVSTDSTAWSEASRPPGLDQHVDLGDSWPSG